MVVDKGFADTARKAPAFQLYVDDFLAGTMSMTAEEVGVYIRLLCIQWSRGMVTQRDVRAAGGSESTNSYVLGAKFAVVEGGYQNERLEKVRHLSDIRKQAASKGGSKTQANRVAKPQANGQASIQQAVSKSCAHEETPGNQQSTSEIASNQIPREIGDIQASGQAKVVASGQANGQAKLNPPTPTPTPTPDRKYIYDHPFFEDSEFRQLFDGFCRASSDTHNWFPGQEVHEAWIYELSRHTIEEAKEMLRFSKFAGSKQPIVNGDHKRTQRSGPQTRGRKVPTLEEGIIR